METENKPANIIVKELKAEDYKNMLIRNTIRDSVARFLGDRDYIIMTLSGKLLKVYCMGGVIHRITLEYMSYDSLREIRKNLINYEFEYPDKDVSQILMETIPDAIAVLAVISYK